MKQNFIDGYMLKKMILGGAKVLEQNKSKVDSLNVFPVPDGDTGTNMSLTMNAAVAELKKIETESVQTVAKKVANGSLMGARGNSGVILSQFFRGFAKGIEGKDTLGALDLAEALKNGADMAYKAVMRPIEGTILTVFRESSKHAVYIARKGLGPVEVLKQTLGKSERVLEKTPDMLPELKEAGVVDAGGKGFVYILEGAVKVLEGEEIIDQEILTHKVEEKPQHKIVRDFKFLYCTEVMARGKFKNREIKDFLKGIGDSVVVIEGDDDLYKIHVHTNSPGDVLNYFSQRGELKKIKIENMKDQHQNSIVSRKDLKPDKPKKNIGVIAVATGEGLKKIFRSLGVDKIIEGGQTMNPSTEDIIKAIESLDNEKFLVLPNNKNILMAAQQASKIITKPVGIIPTKDTAQGINVMLYFDDNASLEENIETMENTLEEIITGQLTFAVRDSSVNGLKIKKGDVIGISNNKIRTAGKEIAQVFINLLEGDVNEDHEILTLFYGKDVKKEDAENMVEKIKGKFPNLEVELHYGGQPLYYYLYSLE